MKTLLATRPFFARLLPLLALSLACAHGLSAQGFSLTAFELELKGLTNEEDFLGIAGTLEAGGAISFGSHFNLSASAKLSSSSVLNLFSPAENFRMNAELEVSSVALEFPFSDGWALTPVVFLGEHADVASGDLLFKSLRVKMTRPEILRYGALSAFSAETNTEGLGAGISWRAEKRPVALAAYGAWDGGIESPGFSAYAQAAGSARGFLWNAFAIFGRGKEAAAISLSADDFYVSGGFSVLAEGESGFSLYVQAKVLPFGVGPAFPQENLETRFHFLFEPRYTARFFAASAAFFLSPVMQDENVPYLDLDEGVLYAGANLRLEAGRVASRGVSAGLNLALLADTSSEAKESWQDTLRICVSPFFKAKGDVFTFTVSAFLNMSKITTPLSAGEINLHLEAAL